MQASPEPSALTIQLLSWIESKPRTYVETMEAAVEGRNVGLDRTLQGRSTIVVPLRARGRSIGAMALMVTATSGR